MITVYRINTGTFANRHGEHDGKENNNGQGCGGSSVLYDHSMVSVRYADRAILYCNGVPDNQKEYRGTIQCSNGFKESLRTVASVET